MMIYLIFTIAICSATKVPENFSGSPEVFSGYLPDKDKYVEAFSYHDDCKVIEGNASIVSLALAQVDPTRKLSENTISVKYLQLGEGAHVQLWPVCVFFY